MLRVTTLSGEGSILWFLAVTIQGRVLIEVTLCCYLLSPNYLCFGKSNGSTLFIIKPPPKLGGTPFWQNINERNHHTKTDAQGRAGERIEWVEWFRSTILALFLAAFIVCIIIYFASNIALGKIYQPQLLKYHNPLIAIVSLRFRFLIQLVATPLNEKVNVFTVGC